MAWIESHQELRNHPKTRKAARLAGITKRDLVGCLHFLWWWALDYAQSGDVTTFDTEELEAEMEWEGEPGKLVSALTSCGQGGGPGFLERTIDGDLLIHDWWDYAGKLIAERIRDRDRKRAGREAAFRQASGGSPADIPRNSDGQTADGGQTAEVQYPTDPTQPNPTQQTEPTESGASATADAAPSREPEGAPLPTPEPEPRKAPKKEPKPQPLYPPAVQVFIANGGKFHPGKLPDGTRKKDQAIQFIVEHVKDDPASLALWGQVVNGYISVQQWAAASFNVMINDYYACGRIPGEKPGRNGNNGHSNSNGQANGRQPKVGIGTVDDYALPREISEAERVELRRAIADRGRQGASGSG